MVEHFPYGCAAHPFRAGARLVNAPVRRRVITPAGAAILKKEARSGGRARRLRRNMNAL